MAIKALADGRYEADIDRKGIKRVRKKFPTRVQAEAFERDYLAQHLPKAGADEDRRKLSELIGLWDQYHGINLADHDKRRRCLDAICAALGNPIAACLTAEDWVKFRYRRTVTDPPEQRITAKTFNNHQGYLAAVFHKLRKLKVIAYECPLVEVEAIKIQERQLSYLSKDEIGTLMDTISSGCLNESTWWVAQICIRTGARWGEAEGLKRKHLHNGRVTFEFTKSKKTRTVPLDPVFFKQLVDYAGGRSPEARLFTGCIGAFRRAVVRAGLELPSGQCSHILRHSFASHFMMGGGNLLTLQKILGHSDIKMTMRYAHLAPEHLADAIRLNPLA
ncbi:Site-specific recombinase XerD [Methylomagnum ishizawai]|uniref:Site-specific recombinase XerD n=1 Tax=Methylomagnum ishizawai TaxID=1760988 RepID=A0A1Y6CVH2_9GAMM|nr:tyrosine-type recombinase/integrase [Methylomagnum ishizawai]SMF94401.1 Site-specific recombinase XerD [Methylomagnum ishizawai]